MARILYVENFKNRVVPMVDGALAIEEGQFINGDTGGFGKIGGDTASEVFLGIAGDAINKTAAENTADGTFHLQVIAKGSGKIVWLPFTGTITIVDVMNGTSVYVDSATEVALVGDTTNDVLVGTLVDIDTNQGIVAVKI